MSSFTDIAFLALSKNKNCYYALAETFDYIICTSIAPTLFELPGELLFSDTDEVFHTIASDINAYYNIKRTFGFLICTMAADNIFVVIKMPRLMKALAVIKQDSTATLVDGCDGGMAASSCHQKAAPTQGFLQGGLLNRSPKKRFKCKSK